MKRIMIIAILFTTSISNAGFGQWIGNMFYYSDYSSGNRYTVQRIGNFDYVSGSNGYRGCGQTIGNSYYYND